jgi:hypothetical protein
MGQHAAAVILATAVQNESVREPWLGVPKRRLQGWRGAEGPRGSGGGEEVGAWVGAWVDRLLLLLLLQLHKPCRTS